MNEIVFELNGAAGGAFAGERWTFRRGEQWAVTGPNGSGKSYLAALLAGEAPTLGVDLTFGEGVGDRVALVTFAQQQEQASGSWLQARWHSQEEDDSLTVRALLSYERINEINPFEVRGDEAAARRSFVRRARGVSDAFELRPLLSRLVVQLSNGEMRRVLLARALLKEPRLLVLDDPFAGLDTAMHARLKQALDRLAAEGLPLVLMVRHDDEMPACVTHLLTLKDLRMAGQRKRVLSCEGRATRMRLPQASLTRRCKDPSREPVIELHNVTVQYGTRVVLDALSWTVRAGERWLVSGPNGSGKTTVLSLITGDNPAAYASAVRVFGRARVPGESLWSVRRRIGQVSPEIQCYFDPETVVLDAVVLGRYNDEGEILRPTRGVRAEARAWLHELGLHGAEQARFGELSAGRQRLVLLARAMLPRPDLLLLDEPCLNLDTASRRLVLSVLERLLRTRHDETVVCVAHRPDDVPRGFGQVLRLG